MRRGAELGLVNGEHRLHLMERATGEAEKAMGKSLAAVFFFSKHRDAVSRPVFGARHPANG